MPPNERRVAVLRFAAAHIPGRRHSDLAFSADKPHSLRTAVTRAAAFRYDLHL